MLRRANPPTYRSPRPAPSSPLGLSDSQLRLVMVAAGPLPPEKRTLLLERIAAKLNHGPAFFSDGDVEAAITAALSGLVHEPA